MSNCPDCGYPVIYETGHWHCTNDKCGVSW
jgi:hypothetical protein